MGYDGVPRDLSTRNRTKIIVGCIIGLIIVIVLVLGITLGILYGNSSPSSSESVGFIAIPDGDIEFSPDDPSSFSSYVDSLQKLIKPYEQTVEDAVECTGDIALADNQVCSFEASVLNYCYKSGSWGYNESRPCVVMTFSDDSSIVKNGVEVYYNLTDIPEDMPDNQQDYLTNRYYENGKVLPKAIWLFCVNGYTYEPLRGFFKAFFPKRNGNDNYRLPLVAVAFDLKDKEFLDVECSLWYKTTDEMNLGTKRFTIRKT